jgi:hypothetical protein
VALANFLCSGVHLMAAHLGLGHSHQVGQHSVPSSWLSIELSLGQQGSNHYPGGPKGGSQHNHSPGMNRVPTLVHQSLFLF